MHTERNQLQNNIKHLWACPEERYEVNLLEECPRMPSARDMLQVVAEDPVAQARFFILSMRLFCEHILGSGQEVGEG